MLLEVRAFGKLNMRYQSAVVDSFPTRQVMELLAYLLLQPRRRHDRETLVTLLWPDRSLAQGRHSLSMVLWRLRRAFQQIDLPADNFIQSTREWVGFVPERPYQFDRDLFEDKCRQAVKAGNPAEQETLLRQADDLYQGPLYEGIYADWCLVERERLALLRLQALARLMECCMRREAYEEAIAWGQTILAEDPLREGVHRALMQCYFQMGQPAQAVQQFTVCAEMLQEMLKCPPQPETIALYTAIIMARFHASLRATNAERLQAQLQAAFDVFWESGRHLNQLLDVEEP